MTCVDYFGIRPEQSSKSVADLIVMVMWLNTFYAMVALVSELGSYAQPEHRVWQAYN
jgi:hypothetical protein